MTARRPSKPWRVLLTRPGDSTRTDFRSSEAAYEHVIEERRKAEDGQAEVTAIRVVKWQEGRWDLYERITLDVTP